MTWLKDTNEGFNEHSGALRDMTKRFATFTSAITDSIYHDGPNDADTNPLHIAVSDEAATSCIVTAHHEEKHVTIKCQAIYDEKEGYLHISSNDETASRHAAFAKDEDVNGALQTVSDMVSLALAKQAVLT